MKNSFKLLLSLVLAMLIISCDPPKDPVSTPDDTPGSTQGAVTPVGTPEGTIVTAIIGPAGGTIESADKRIHIAVPAGALTSDQTLSVQPLTNQCPAGTGQAYRLMPHGVIFAKPADITFQYNDPDIKGSAPAALRIAYQSENGMWKSPVVKNLDSTARTVRVQTTHFSDWGLFQEMTISPENAFVNPGETIRFIVTQTVGASGPEDDEVFVPLPTMIPAKYVDKWTLSGAGSLTDEKNKADYKAPSTIPDINPAAITVFLNKTVIIEGKEFKDIRLVANVFVAPEGISVQIDGGDWRTYGGGVSIKNGRNVILGKDGAESVSVQWNGAPTGTFHWTKGIDVSFNINKGKLIYAHLYGKGPNVSGGSVMANNTDETWMVGSFTVQPAGWTNTGTQPLSIGTAGIKGVFRIKRVN